MWIRIGGGIRQCIYGFFWPFKGQLWPIKSIFGSICPIYIQNRGKKINNTHINH